MTPEAVRSKTKTEETCRNPTTVQRIAVDIQWVSVPKTALVSTHLKVIPRQILMSYFSQAVILVSTLLVIRVLTNAFATRAEYGSYCLISSLASYCMVLAGLGIHRYMAKAVPGVEEEEQYTLFARTTVIQTGTYLLLLGVLILCISPLCRTLGIYRHRATVILFVSGYLLYFLHVQILRFLGLQKRLGTQLALGACERPMLLAAVLSVALAWRRLALDQVFLLHTGVFAVLLFLSSRFLKTGYFRSIRWSELLSNARAIVFCVPFLFLIDLLFKTKNVLPRYFLSMFAGDEAVAVYAISDALIRVLYMMVTPFIVILYPYVAEQVKLGQKNDCADCRRRAASLLRASFKLCAYFFVAMTPVVYCYGRECILLLSREDYLPALAYLPYFTVSYSIMIFVLTFHPMLILTHDVRKLTLVHGLLLIAGTALSFLLTRCMLIKGAILGVIGTDLAIALYVALLLRRYLQEILSFMSCVALAAYGLAAWGAALLIKEYLVAPVTLKATLTCVVLSVAFLWLRRRDIHILFHHATGSRESIIVR